MPRSVVTRGTPRCPGCLLAARWCICAEREQVRVPVAVTLLMHPRELGKPSSSGLLAARVMPGLRVHPYDHLNPDLGQVLPLPGKETWLLHPEGEPFPEVVPEAGGVQLVLIEGSWKQAGGLLEVAAGVGVRRALALEGSGRYWLRTRQEGARFSTAEALIGAMEWFGLGAQAEVLRRQLELHVFAALLSRGKRKDALDYLRESPVAEAFPGGVARLLGGGPSRGP